MANKEKTIIPNKLLKIREELGYSQKEIGEILGVSDRMICNYETGENNLPIDKAVFISQKWNYDLNWIYNKDTKDKISTIISYPKEENTNFLVDIRDFINKKDNTISFSIPEYYWIYIRNINEIRNSSRSEQEKKRAIAQLNDAYKIDDKNNLFWECSFDIDTFISMIHFGENSSCIYSSNETSDTKDVTEKQIKEVTDFLISLTTTNSEE